MARRPPRRRVGMLGRTIALLKDHDLLMLGAGIAFFFTLALIPLVLLGTSTLGYALGSPKRAATQILPAIRLVVPSVTTRQIEPVVRSLVEGRTIAGWLGLLSLLWVASGAYDTIANALTTLSGLQETRSYLRRKLQAAALMVASGALFLSILVLSSLATAVRGLGNRILELLPGGIVLPPGSVLALVPPLLVAATFLLMYRWAPARPFAWGPAVIGAGLGGILWYVAKRVFEWYLLRVARQGLVYGLLGSFIGLLLWVYYMSLIFLLGAVVALACWPNRPPPEKP